MEIIERKIRWNLKNKTLTCWVPSHAEDIDIIEHTKLLPLVLSNARLLIWAWEWMRAKIIYILSTNRDKRHKGYQISANDYTFDIVSLFIMVSSLQLKILSVWRWNVKFSFYRVSRQEAYTSRSYSLAFYMAPIHVCCQDWKQQPWEYLKVFSSKFFGLVRAGDGFRIRTNKELYDFLTDRDVEDIKRLRWLVHSVGM